MPDNMNPHAEARLAMALWGEEYAGQRGGAMDFWNNLRPHRQHLCTDILDAVLKALEANGRAKESDQC